jgi:hypothetical protein
MKVASSVTNEAIQQVTYYEQRLLQDHPHLNTVYRVLSVVCLQERIQDLTTIVTETSCLAELFTERHAVEFLGDAMECAFRPSSDPYKAHFQSYLVKDFLERWQISEDDALLELYDARAGGSRYPLQLKRVLSVQQVFDDVDAMVRLEAPLESDALRGACEIAGRRHSWLPMFTRIGRNHAITHTIRLLQDFSFADREGTFGPSWSDRIAPTDRIQKKMDVLLMEHILPSLTILCDGNDFPRQSWRMTALNHIHSFVNDSDRTVTWSLAFAVHCMLSAVTEVHGARQVSYLARHAFYSSMNQLDSEESRAKSAPRRAAVSRKRSCALQKRLLSTEAQLRKAGNQEVLSLWNPYCAGAFLSFIS